MKTNKEWQMRLLLLLVCVFWFGQYVYIPYQTSYLISKGVSQGFVGMIVGAYGLVQVFFRIPAGVLADTGGGHKRIITAGIICVGMASLIRVLFPNAAGFFVANLFSGLGASAWISYMVFYMSFFENEKLQAATGKIIAANNTGVFIGFVSSSMLYGKIGMKGICFLSVLTAMAGTALCLGIREEKPKKKAFSKAEVQQIFGFKRLLFFSILALLQQGVQMATCMSFTIQTAKELGALSWQVGVTSIVYIVLAVCFSYLSSRKVFVQIGHKRIVPAGLLLQALYCVLVPNAGSVYQIYLCQILAAAAMGFLFTSLTSESMRGIPLRFYSTAMGIFQAVYAVGMTLFPIVAGKIRGYEGNAAAYYFMAGCLVLGFVASLVFYLHTEKRSEYEICG